jgi:hypothetical protein
MRHILSFYIDNQNNLFFVKLYERNTNCGDVHAKLFVGIFNNQKYILLVEATYAPGSQIDFFYSTSTKLFDSGLCSMFLY